MYMWRLQVMYMLCIYGMYVCVMYMCDTNLCHMFLMSTRVVYVYGVLFVSVMYLILWIRIYFWFHEVCLYVYFIQVSSTWCMCDVYMRRICQWSVTPVCANCFVCLCVTYVYRVGKLLCVNSASIKCITCSHKSIYQPHIFLMLKTAI